MCLKHVYPNCLEQYNYYCPLHSSQILLIT